MDTYLSSVPPRPQADQPIGWHTEEANKVHLLDSKTKAKKPLSAGVISIISFLFGISLFGALLWVITFLQDTPLGSFMAKAAQQGKATILLPDTRSDILCPNGVLNAVTKSEKIWTIECAAPAK